MRGFLVVLVTMVLAACGGGSDRTTTFVDDVPDPTTSAPAPDTSTAEPDPLPPGEGLAVRIRGLVDRDRVCPDGARPCVPVDGDVEADGDGQVVVVGRLLDGRLVLARQEMIPPRPWHRADECETEPAPPDLFVQEIFGEYEGRTVEAATAWVTPAGTLHLGVVGDAAPHEAAFDELGIGDHACVVGGFARSNVELREVIDVSFPVLRRLAEESGTNVLSAYADGFEGAAVFELGRVDRPMLDEVELAYGDLVALRAPIEVLDGTMAELDEALAAVEPPTGPPEIRTVCGDAVLPGVPPDLDALAPLGEEARGALDAARASAALQGEEAFLDAYDWSIAERSERRLVLLGRSPIDDGDLASIAFARVDDGSWTPTGFGGCSVRVTAVGFGPATTTLDPDREPDPASTSLPVLIDEHACASGQAPTDREILPVVTETEASVEIVVLVAASPGISSCPGNPPHPITVELDAPLGDRIVLDGSSQPPIERSWPPSPEELFGG